MLGIFINRKAGTSSQCKGIKNAWHPQNGPQTYCQIPCSTEFHYRWSFHENKPMGNVYAWEDNMSGDILEGDRNPVAATKNLAWERLVSVFVFRVNLKGSCKRWISWTGVWCGIAPAWRRAILSVSSTFSETIGGSSSSFHHLRETRWNRPFLDCWSKNMINRGYEPSHIMSASFVTL